MRPVQTQQSPGGAGLVAENQNNFASTDFNALPKPEATAIAKLAFAGHVVHRGKCNDFIVSKWGMTYYAQDFDELEKFAKKLGVAL